MTTGKKTNIMTALGHIKMYRHTDTASTDATDCEWDWSYTGTASATL